MSKRHPPEPWMVPAVRRFARIFALDEWDIRVTTAKRPGGRVETAEGRNRFDTWYTTSEIVLRRGAALSEDSLEVTLHEVLHLALHELRDASDDAIRLAPKAARVTLRRQYDRAEERLVTRLARGLVRHFDLLERVAADTQAAQDETGDQAGVGTDAEAAAGGGPGAGATHDRHGA